MDVQPEIDFVVETVSDNNGTNSALHDKWRKELHLPRVMHTAENL